MTANIRPSDGRVTSRAHLDLNRGGWKAGHRVLFVSSGRWDAGPIVEVRPHSVAFESTLLCPDSGTKHVVGLQAVAGRLRSGMRDAEALALVERLNAAEEAHGGAVAAARKACADEQARLMRKAGVR